MTLTQIVVASLLSGLLSMAIAAFFTFGLPRHWLTRMVSFSTGALLGAALLDLLPEALEGGLAPHSLFSWLLAGLIGFYLLERFALWHHDHGGPHEPGHGMDAAAPMIIIGDGIHNLADGLLLAAAFLADPKLGWVTALAIITHEVPQEAGNFALLLAAGWGRTKAFVWNGISSLTSVAGGVAGYFWLDGAQAWIPAVLTVAAASFIYIAVSDLMPWLRREKGAFAWHSGLLAAGVATVSAGMHALH